MNYREQLRDPHWQKLRLKVMERDGWHCQSIACAAVQNSRVMLVVHHKRYIAGNAPWEYSPDDLVTLCQKCHDSIHSLDAPEVHPILVKGRCYHWREIKRLIGHEPIGYLTQIGQSIVCGCFRADLNPNAPDIVLPGGNDPQWVAKARLFQRQSTPIPIFVKAEGMPWEFVGQFRVETITQNSTEIQIHRERHGLRDIGAVVFLSEGKLTD